MADTNRDYTADLVDLSTAETRIRLGELMQACRARADAIGGFQGQGLNDQVASAERKLRLAARDQIRHLAECLATYGTPLPGDEPALAAPAPAPVVEAPPPPAAAPQGMRLPRLPLATRPTLPRRS